MALIDELVVGSGHEEVAREAPVEPEEHAQQAPREPEEVAREPAPAPAPAKEEPRRERTDDIPYPRFREVLDDRNSLKAKLEEIESRLKAYEVRAEQPKVAEESAPSADDDPVAYAIWQGNQAERASKEIREYMQRQQQTEAYHREVQAVTQRYQASAAEYIKEVPDFMDAYAHAINVRTQQLMLFGATAEQAQQTIMGEELQLAHNALANGRNPADVIYNMARVFGYQSKQGQPAQQNANVAADKIKQVKAGKNAEGLGSSAAESKEPEDEDVPRGSFKEFEQAFKERGFRRRH